MKPSRMLLPTLVILASGCANQSPPKPVDRTPVILGMSTAQGKKIIDSVYSNLAVRPDTVMNQGGMLRVVLPGKSFGHSSHIESSNCTGPLPPLGPMRAVAAHAWAARDSSIRRDTVQVVISVTSDTIRHASLLGESARICSSGPVVFPVDVTKLPEMAARAPRTLIMTPLSR